jgi:hypothetical protein
MKVEDACRVTVGRAAVCGAVVVGAEVVCVAFGVLGPHPAPINTIASRTSRVDLPNEFLRILKFLLN